jgi:hypothetical protein
VFTARYGLGLYIKFRLNSLFKGLTKLLWPCPRSASGMRSSRTLRTIVLFSAMWRKNWYSPCKVGCAHVWRAWKSHFPVSMSPRSVLSNDVQVCELCKLSVAQLVLKLLTPYELEGPLVFARAQHLSCTGEHNLNVMSSMSRLPQLSFHFRFSEQNYTVYTFFVCSVRATCLAQHIVPDVPTLIISCETPLSCRLGRTGVGYNLYGCLELSNKT